MNKTAVQEVGLIERRESILRRLRVPAQMLFHERGLRGQRRRQTAHLDPVRKVAHHRELRRELPIHKHEPGARQSGENQPRELVRAEAVRNLERRFERKFGDRCDVGEPPVLVFERGQPQFLKSGEPGLAQGRSQSGWPARVSRRLNGFK